MGIAQNIRIEHDLDVHRYFRKNRTWQVLTAIYYLVILIVAVIALMHDVDLIDMPLVAFIFMMMCPFVFIMLYGDLKLCIWSAKE